jgi:hypothetical protein
MSIGQDIFGSLLQHIWGFVREESERRGVSKMTPEKLEHWRTEEFTKLRKQAIKLAGFTTDKELHQRGIQREELVRIHEVLLRNDLGLRMSQYLLAGMDIRGLDLRRVRGLDQLQIDHAVGDATTQLPAYLQVPHGWDLENRPAAPSDTAPTETGSTTT